MPAQLAAGSKRMISVAERYGVANSKCVLNVKHPCPVARRAKPKPVSHVAIASDVYLGKVGNLGGERILDAEIGILEIGNRNRVVAVAEEPGSKLIYDFGAEDLDVGQREASLIGCLFSLEPAERARGNQRITARLIREKELAADLV